MAPRLARRLIGALILASTLLGARALAQAPALETATTADGETLALGHYATPGGAPVLLIHGFGANGNEWDLPSESFARTLRAAGYDVWIGNWRRSGKAPMRSSGAAGYTFDDVVAYDVPALVEKVCAASGRPPFVIGHSMGAMTTCAYLEGCHYQQVVVARTPSFSLSGLTWKDVKAQRIVADPALAATRNAGIRGFVDIAGPARMAWGVNATAYNFWKYSYWDYDLVLPALSWSPGAIVFAYTARELPQGQVLDFLTRDLTKLPYVGSSVQPFLRAVTAQVAPSFLLSNVMYGPNVDGQVAYEGLHLAIEDMSCGVFRQMMDGVRNGTLREAHVTDPARSPTVYCDLYGRVSAPVLVVGGTYDKVCNDEVLFASGFQKMGSADGTYLSVDAGHGDVVIGKNGPGPGGTWAKIIGWLAVR